VDKELAEALLDMLCTALALRRGDFLCTSVDGAKLRGGDDTDIQLRQVIRDVPIFLSILTPIAVASTYVLFELGARWGADKHHIPLVAKCKGVEVLREPLKSKNALRLDHAPDVLGLVERVAQLLRRPIEPAPSYHEKVVKIVEISKLPAPAAAPARKEPASDYGVTDLLKQPEIIQFSLSNDAKKLMVESSKSADGFVHKMRTHMGELIVLHITDQSFLGNQNDDARTRARWGAAFNELVLAGCLAESTHEGVYIVSHLGYQLADLLKAS
jgi:hypothetical protein